MLQVLICIINLVLYHSIKCCLKSAIYSSPFSSLFIIYSLCLQINPTRVVKTNSLFFFFWFEGYISAVIKVSIMLLLCNRPDMSQTQWEGCKFSCRALQMSLHSQISPYLVLARAPVLLSLSLDTSVAWLWNMWKLWMFIPDLDSGSISLSNSDVPWNSLAWSTRCGLPAFLPHLEAANITYKYWIKEGLQCCPVFFFAGDLTNCTSRSPWLIKTSSCASGEWPSSL